MLISNIKLSAAAAFLAAIMFTGFTISVQAQQGNTVTGQVTGYENKPMYDATVELLNDYGSAIAYTRTDGSGRYFFSNVKSGRFSIRVRTIEPEYEEQTQSEEIVNFTRQNQDGSQTQSGMEHKQLDFRMRVRKGFTGITAALFVQDVPPNAKKLYEQAVTDLNAKKQKESLTGLKAAIEAFPKYFAALELLGTEYVKMKEYAASATLLQLAVEVNPRSYASWYGLAYSLNSLGYVDEGLSAVNKAVELYNGSTESLILAGVINRAKKQYPEAEKHLLKAKELSKDTLPMANWYLALLYGNEMKRYADAARELKLFLKKQPDTKDAEKLKQLIVSYEEKAKTN